jgi:hypothetical protein
MPVYGRLAPLPLFPGRYKVSLIFQELQQLDDELSHVHSALPLEEDEFLRCMAFKAASKAEPVNGIPDEELLWAPDQKKEFFSPTGSHWVASGWSNAGLPEHSASHQSLPPVGSVEDCFFDHSLDEPASETDEESMPRRSLRPMVNCVRISDERVSINRRERTRGGDGAGKNVNVVAAVAIGLMAVSFAVGLAQRRSGSKVRH